MSPVSTPLSLDSCPMIFLQLVACMTLQIGYSISRNIANKNTYVIKEKDSPELKKKAKR
jgi:hypothetical protein